MSEQWLIRDVAVELIRTLRNTSIGTAQAWLKAARDSGEVRTRPRPVGDPVRLTADDGLIDFNLRPGSLNKYALTDGERHTVDGRRLLDEFNKDDLLYWLDQHHPLPTTKPARASREQVDRDAAKRVINLLYPTLPGVRELPYKKLHGKVNDHLKANGEKTVGLDTVSRAAKEIRAAAADAMR
jgi:hypothetical protein